MKSALVVWGGWEGHEPKQCVDVFIPWLKEQGYDVEVANSLEPFADADRMAKVDLIVPCWTMGEMAAEQEKGLLEAVRNGAGIAGWHGGMGDAFRQNTGYQFMTGGQFVDHPGGIIDYEVNIVKKDDPIVAGIEDFGYRSEQYYMHVDPSNEVLATTTVGGDHFPWLEGTVMPVVWKRPYGKGKVFYSALGHAATEFEEYPQAREIVQRGMLWASR